MMMRGLIGCRPEEKKRTCGPYFLERRQNFFVKLTFCPFFFFFVKGYKRKKMIKKRTYRPYFFRAGVTG